MKYSCCGPIYAPRPPDHPIPERIRAQRRTGVRVAGPGPSPVVLTELISTDELLQALENI